MPTAENIKASNRWAGSMAALWAQYIATKVPNEDILSRASNFSRFGTPFNRLCGSVFIHLKQECADSTEELMDIPENVVVEIADIFVRYLSIDAGDKSEDVCIYVGGAKSIPPGDFFISPKHIFPGKDQDPVPDLTALAILRENFMTVLGCLSSIALNKSTREVMCKKLGYNFTRIIAETIHFFIDKVEEVSVSWIDVIGISAVGSEKKSSQILCDDTNFIISALHLLVNLVHRSAPSCLDTVNRLSCHALPNQPWTEQECIEMRFKQPTRTPVDKEEAHETRNNIARTGKMFPGDVLPLSCADSPEQWIKEFVFAGSIRVIVSLLRKLIFLSGALCKIVNSQKSPNSAEHYIWTNCLVLETEGLTTLSSIIVTNPTLGYPRFHNCSGAEVTSMILSCKDGVPYYIRECPKIISLVVQRGLVCIRLSEVMLRASKASLARVENSIDIDVGLANLTGFMVFLHTYGYYLDFKRVNGVTSDDSNGVEGAALRKARYTISCTTASTVKSPNPTSDLWPWRETSLVSLQDAVSSSSTVENGTSYTLCKVEPVTENNDTPPQVHDERAESASDEFVNSIQSFSGIRQLHDICSEKFTLNPFLIFDENDQVVSYMGVHIAQVWRHLFHTLWSIVSNNETSSVIRSERNDIVACLSTVIANAVAGTMTCLATEVRTEGDKQLPPVLQSLLVLFLSRLLSAYPIETVVICRRCNTWKLLAQSSTFLKGGRAEAERALKLGKVTKTSGGVYSPSETVNFEIVPPVPGLESDVVRPKRVPLLSDRSRSVRFTDEEKMSTINEEPPFLLPAHDSGSSIVSSQNDVGPQPLRSLESQMSQASQSSSVWSVGTKATVGNHTSEFDEEDYLTGDDEDSDDSSTPLPAQFSAGSQISSEAAEDYPSTGAPTLSTSEGEFRGQAVNGYFWMLIHDAILDVFAYSVVSLNSNANFIASKQGPKPEIDCLIGTLSSSTPDFMVTRIIRWIGRLFGIYFPGDNIGGRSDKLKLTVEQLLHACGHVMTKCLSICKYHVATMSTGETSDKKSMPLLWVDDENTVANALRLTGRHFYHPMRSAVITLMMNICTVSPQLSWNSMQISDISIVYPYRTAYYKHLGSAAGGSGTTTASSSSMANNNAVNSHIRKVQSKYFVLLQLLLIPDCRDAVLFILTELIYYYGSIIKTEFSAQSVGSVATGVSTVSPSQANLNNDELDAQQLQSGLYTAYIHDVLKWLFLHVRCAPQQPARCDAVTLASRIFEWLTSLLRSPGKIYFVKHHQSILDSYGTMTIFHSSLSWPVSRFNIFREVFRSIDPCLQVGGAGIDIIRHALSFLTAVMINNDHGKEKFHSLMLMQKRKGGSKPSTGNFSFAMQFPYRTCNLHDLCDIIIAAEYRISMATIQIFLDMLLDGGSLESKSEIVLTERLQDEGMYRFVEGVPLICNTTALPVLFALLPQCDAPLQTFLINTLKNLIMGHNSVINMSKCSQMQPPVIDMILDVFLDLNTESHSVAKDLIQTMGRHNISVSQLKRIFGLMQSRDKYRPACTWRLLSALQGMITPAEGPRHYVLFEGKDSGLSLPPVVLPVRNSFSFSMWFCVDSQHTDRIRNESTSTDASPINLFLSGSMPSQRKSQRPARVSPVSRGLDQHLAALGYRSADYCPTLLSIRGENGDGLEVFLKQDVLSPNEFTLEVKVYRNKGDTSKNGKVEILHCKDENDNVIRPVSEGVWHYLGVSHSDGTFRSKGEVSILLDNNYSRHPLQFPKLKETIPELYIGDCVESLKPPDTNTTLRGRIGATYFFHEALSESQLKYIYSRGASYAGHFSHRDTTDNEEGFLSSVLDGILSTSIILAYNPAVFSGNEILDYTPQKNILRCKKTKSRPSSTNEVVKEDAVNTMLSSGISAHKHTGTHCCTTRDIRDALYCLGGYNVLLPIFSQFDQPTRNADGTDNFEVDPKLCVTVLELLFALLHDIPAVDQNSRLCGFELTGYFLERVSPAHLNLHVFDTIIALLCDLDWDSSWHRGVVQYLLVNFKLWVYTPFHVQNKLFLYVMKLSEQYPVQMRELLPFQALLDLLSTLYALPIFDTDLAKDISDKDHPIGFKGNDADGDDEEIDFGSSKIGGESTAPAAVWAKFGYDAPKWVHPLSGDVVGKKLEGEELDCIRRYIFDMALHMILAAAQNENEPIETYVQNILRMLTVTSGLRGTVQIIQFFLNVLSHAPDRGVGGDLLAHRLIAGLSQQSRVFPILNLCHHHSGTVRLLGFAAFCNVIQVIVSYGKISSIGSVSTRDNGAGTQPNYTMFDEEQTAPTGHGLNPVEQVNGQSQGRARDHSVTIDDMLDAMQSPGPIPVSPAAKFSHSDSFSAIGIPHRNLDTIFNWIQRKLHQFIAFECRSGDHSKITFYCRLIIATMQYTMMGKSSINFFTSLLDPTLSASRNYVSVLDELNNTKLSVDSNILESNIFVTEICTIMLFVPLLRFVQHNIVPSSFRLSTIVNLKTTLHCYSNIESLFRAPDWLPCMFELLSTEEQKILTLENHLETLGHCSSTDEGDSNIGTSMDVNQLSEAGVDNKTLTSKILLMKEINRSKGVVETTIRMFSDLMAHAMQHGVPKNSPYVVRPPHIQSRTAGPRRSNAGADYGSDFTQPLPFADMLVELQLDHRMLGVTLLQDYVGYMRFYAETKYLEVRELGLNLLQQMIDTTKREIHFLNQAPLLNSDLFSKLRMRFLLINVWLLTSIILDFITLPVIVIQGRPERLTRSASSGLPQTPGDVHSSLKAKAPATSHSPISALRIEEIKPGVEPLDKAPTSDDYRPKRRTSATLSAIKTLQSLELKSRRTSDVEISDDGSDYSERESDMSVDCVEAFEERSRRRSRGSSIAHDNFIGLADEARDLERERKRFKNSKKNVDFTFMEWKLLDSMLDLLESLDGDVDISSTTRTYRFKLGLTLGIKSALELSNQVHLTIDKIAGVSTAPKSFLNMVSEGTQLEYASTNVCWTIARVLCSFFIKGSSSGPKCWHTTTLSRLKLVLASLKQKDDAHLLEAIYIVNEIAAALSQTTQTVESAWVREALVFLTMELSTKRREIATILLKAFNADARKSLISKSGVSITEAKPYSPAPSFYRSLSSPSDSPGTGSAVLTRLLSRGDSTKDCESSDTGSFCDQTDINTMFISLSGPDMVEYDQFAAAEIVDRAIIQSASSGTPELTLELINTVLNLSPDYRVLSWVQWKFALFAIDKGAKRREEEATCARLTELGHHKHTEELRKQQSARDRLVVRNFKRLTIELEILADVMVNAETVRAQDAWKRDSTHARKQKARWNIILQDLASERGIWGLGAGESSNEVFVQLSPCENEVKMRPLMIRNAMGTRHEFASRLTNPSDCASPVSEEKQNLEGKSDRGDIGYSVRRISFELWKDLRKYRGDSKRLSIVREDSEDEDEEAADELRMEMGQQKSDTTKIVNADGISVVTPSKADYLLGGYNLLNPDRVQFTANCEIITQSTNATNPPSSGTVTITKYSVVYVSKSNVLQGLPGSNGARGNTEHLWACRSFPSSEWRMDQIVNLSRRTYQLRNVAVELYLDSRTSIFFNMFDQTTCRRFEKVICQYMKPYRLIPAGALVGVAPSSASDPVSRSAVMDIIVKNLAHMWRHRELTNFEYLMHLNNLAGRSYNDLGQYPVFPWVIADYTSPQLDLRDPATFRDLKWPMGAQDPQQREKLMAKYKDLYQMYQMTCDGTDDGYKMPPFHYGSHYSAAAFVLWYLLRLEPYTSLHVQLQEGKFDKADRLFDSIAATWRGCTSNPADVKELIPEFFYCAEMFENPNNIEFGTTQTGKVIDGVQLPPWATDAQDFVTQHREALESEYVSKNLHHWIDLIFGFKQRPPHVPGGSKDSITACNVFFHLTYAGAVDLEEVLKEDSALYDQHVKQITEFGQTPMQLFNTPHIERLPIDAVDIIFPIASTVRGIDTIPRGAKVPLKPKRVVSYRSVPVSIWPIVMVFETHDRLITLDSSRIAGMHAWQVQPPDVMPPFKIKVDTGALEFSQGLSTSGIFSRMSSSSAVRDRRVGVPFAAESIKSQSQLNRESIGDNAMMAVMVSKKTFEKYEKDSRHSKISRKTLSSSSSNDGSRGSTAGSPPNRLDYSRQKRTEVMSPPLSRSPDRESKRATLTSNTAANSSGQSGKVNSMMVRDDHIHSGLFAFHEETKLLFSCGHWDHSFKVTALETGRLLQSVSNHRDVITCLSLATDFNCTWLVSGSRDCTVMVWEVVPEREINPVTIAPLFTLFGHDDAVTSIKVCPKLNLVISGSEDGTVIMHSLREGAYVRSIVVGPDYGIASAPNVNLTGTNEIVSETATGSQNEMSTVTHNSGRRRINWIGVTFDGVLVVYLLDDHLLCSYTINGRTLATRTIKDKLHALTLSTDGKVLMTGGNNGLVVLRWVHTLALANTGARKDLEAVFDGSSEEATNSFPPFNAPIRSLSLTRNERHLIVGLENGEIRILAQDSDYLRQRLQKKLIEIGIL